MSARNKNEDKGRSERQLFGGGYNHYDSKGRKTGESRPNLFGDGFTHYDSKGHKIGESRRSFWADGFVDYDEDGHKTGSSRRNLTGGYRHYDAAGHKVGESDRELLTDGYRHRSTSEGCYIATCIYGSYDCPEVWTLRRFRDNCLAAHFPGRLFIRCYYAASPALVRRWGSRLLFRIIWKRTLDKMVYRLQQKGFTGLPYRDLSDRQKNAPE